MVSSSFSPVGRAVLDDILSCAAKLWKSDTINELRLVVNRMVALSRKMNQLHNEGILTESEFTALNLALLVLGIRGMNRLYCMQGVQHINK